MGCRSFTPRARGGSIHFPHYTMQFQFNDGGRAAAGFEGDAGDCVTRAIAIATGIPYQDVYDAMWSGIKEYAANHRDRVACRMQRGGGRKGTTPRNGVSDKVYRPFLEAHGWRWHPTMQIGQGCKVHLKAEELPPGRLIVRVSKHMLAVIDGVIHDTYQDDRGGTRCVYGYFAPYAASPLPS